MRVSLSGYYDHTETVSVSKHETVSYSLLPVVCVLTVDSMPKGAAIYINGQLRGNTPSTIPGLKGSYSLRVSLSGYYDHTETVSVSKHETVSYSLLPIVCVLTVDSMPQGAAIYFNGQLRGNTPASISGLKGRYSLKLTLTGYRDYDVTVDVDGMAEVLFTLSPSHKS